MVERAVLHAEDDDVVEAGITRLRELAPLRLTAGKRPPGGEAYGRHAGKELTTGGHGRLTGSF